MGPNRPPKNRHRANKKKRSMKEEVSPTVRIQLTQEEAVELFERCLKSSEEDSGSFSTALLKLAAAVAYFADERLAG